jgi:hypothetical protein
MDFADILMARLFNLQGGMAPATSDFVRLQTSSTGSNWVKAGSQECQQVSVKNKSGAAIRVAKGNGTSSTPTDANKYLVLEDGENWLVRGITNITQVYFKRDDESNTQVTVQLEWEHTPAALS